MPDAVWHFLTINRHEGGNTTNKTLNHHYVLLSM